MTTLLMKDPKTGEPKPVQVDRTTSLGGTPGQTSISGPVVTPTPTVVPVPSTMPTTTAPSPAPAPAPAPVADLQSGANQVMNDLASVPDPFGGFALGAGEEEGENAPWKTLQPHLQELYERANQALDEGTLTPDYGTRPDQVAPPPDATKAAWKAKLAAATTMQEQADIINQMYQTGLLTPNMLTAEAQQALASLGVTRDIAQQDRTATAIEVPTIEAPSLEFKPSEGATAQQGTAVQTGAVDTQVLAPGAAPQVDLAARVNPMETIEQMLAGEVDVSQVGAMTEAATEGMREQFERVVLPGIRSEATAAGQAGSSRRGVAEGLAAEAFTQEVGDVSRDIALEAARMAQSRQETGLAAATELQAQADKAAIEDARLKLGLEELGIQAQTSSVGAALEARQQDLTARLGEVRSGIEAGTLQLDADRTQLDAMKTDIRNRIDAMVAQGNVELATAELMEMTRSGKTGEALAALELSQELATDAAELKVKKDAAMLTLAPMMQQLQTVPLELQSEVGKEQWAFDQAKIEAALEQWSLEENQEFESLTRFANLLTGQGVGTMADQPDQTQSTSQRVGAAAGVGLSTWAMMSSNPLTAPYAPAVGGAMAVISLLS